MVRRAKLPAAAPATPASWPTPVRWSRPDRHTTPGWQASSGGAKSCSGWPGKKRRAVRNPLLRTSLGPSGAGGGSQRPDQPRSRYQADGRRRSRSSNDIRWAGASGADGNNGNSILPRRAFPGDIVDCADGGAAPPNPCWVWASPRRCAGVSLQVPVHLPHPTIGGCNSFFQVQSNPPTRITRNPPAATMGHTKPALGNTLVY